MDRRSFLSAAPAVLVAGTAGGAVISDPTDPCAAIRHHIAEAVRLLRETAPKGFEVQTMNWTACFGPEAPEDLMVCARGDTAQDYGRAFFRPSYDRKLVMV